VLALCNAREVGEACRHRDGSGAVPQRLHNSRKIVLHRFLKAFHFSFRVCCATPLEVLYFSYAT